MRAGLALGAVILTSGCVALGGIDRTAFTIDKSVGDARNRSILTNIVRASNSEPLYFYSINQVSGSGLAQYNFSLPAVAEGSRQTITQDNYTFGATNLLEGQQTGNFQVAVLDFKNSQYWHYGAVDLTEINVLLRQGFPRELVYRLAVDGIHHLRSRSKAAPVRSGSSKGSPAALCKRSGVPRILRVLQHVSDSGDHARHHDRRIPSSIEGRGQRGRHGRQCWAGRRECERQGRFQPSRRRKALLGLALVTDPTALKDVEDFGMPARSAHGGSRGCHRRWRH